MRKLSKCALCDNQTTLELSHIVPKMAVRQLKKTSAGAIRNTDNPNMTTQDSEKHYMLCCDCEDRFSAYETYFARAVFHPYLKGETDTFNYDDTLARFMTSVSWRSTYLDILDYVEDGVVDIDVLNCLIESERIMKDFLLEKRVDLGYIENHIFFFAEIESVKGKSKEEIQELRPHVSLHRGITSYDEYIGAIPTLESGEGNAPPEDVGGAEGYTEFLYKLQNGKYTERQEKARWGKSYGYEEFDLEKMRCEVERALRR